MPAGAPIQPVPVPAITPEQAATPPPLSEQSLPVVLNPAAPLNPSMPSAHPVVNAGIGGGLAVGVNTAVGVIAGAELTPLAICLNVAVEWFKRQPWFREESWTVPLVFLLGFGVAFLLWIVVPLVINGVVDALAVREAVTKGSGMISNVHTNFEASQMAGASMFKSTPVKDRWATTHPPTA